MKRALTKTTPRKAEFPPRFRWGIVFSIADVISTNFHFGIWHMHAIWKQYCPCAGCYCDNLGDCFTQIRWELILMKECLSLTITVMPCQCPQCKFGTLTCISQVLWFKEETSGLNGEKKKTKKKNLSLPTATLTLPLKMVGPGLH